MSKEKNNDKSAVNQKAAKEEAKRAKKEKKLLKKKDKKPNKFVMALKNKWLMNGAYTLLLVAIIIAIYVALNVWVDSLDIKDLDLTSEKLYSLSQESKDKLANINEDTTILFFGMQDYSTTKDLAKQYNGINEHIKFEEVTDVTSRPDLVSEYGLENDSNAIIIETSQRKKILTTSDLSTYDYTTYESIDISEEAMTNAILDVNLEKKPKIYNLSSHTTYAKYLSMATTYLENEANEVESIDLLVKGGVPEDCDVLMITTLKEDITEQEKDMIISYINKGGNLLILQDPDYVGVSTPNYQAVLDVYGVSVSEGIVFEGDSSKQISGYPNVILPQISYSSDVTKYIASDGAVVFANSGKLNFKSDEELENLGVETENLLTVSSSAYLRKNLNNSSTVKNATDTDIGNEAIGALLTKKINDDTNSQLIIYANAVFATDMPIQLGNSGQYAILLYNNRDLVMNSVSYLTQRTDTITIRKDTGTVTITTTADQKRNIVIIIIALPIIIIIAGIIVWQKRRRKK